MAAEEDKLHQQGSLFKAQKPYSDNQDADHDTMERDESRESLSSLRDDVEGGEGSEGIRREKGVAFRDGDGGGDLGGDGGHSEGDLIEVEAARGPSLGSGVIEDYSSFSPFKSLFTSAAEGAGGGEGGGSSVAVNINSARSSSSGSSGRKNNSGNIGSSGSSDIVTHTRGTSNSNRYGSNNGNNGNNGNSNSSTPLRSGGRNGVSRKYEIDRERRRRQHSSASKSYSPQGLNDNDDIETDALQITSMHAVGFILLSSSFLLIMFFVDIYSFVSLMYLVAAGFAAAKVFFYPFFTRLVRTYTAIRTDVEIDEVPDHGGVGEVCGVDLPMVLSGGSRYLFRFNYCVSIYQSISLSIVSFHPCSSLLSFIITVCRLHHHRLWSSSSLSSGLVSLGLGVTWYRYSESIAWVWLLQDFLGVSVCILFLSSVHLPNLQAATLLLGKWLCLCFRVIVAITIAAHPSV